MREESAQYDAGRTPFGINLAVGAVVMVAVAFAAAPFPQVDARLVAVACAAGGYAARVADTRASFATAGIGYLIFDGFLVNHFGELTWGGMTNVWYLMLFVLAVGLGLAGRRIRAVRADRALAREAAGLARANAAKVIDKKEALRG